MKKYGLIIIILVELIFFYHCEKLLAGVADQPAPLAWKNASLQEKPMLPEESL